MEVEFNKKNNLTVYILLMKIKNPLLILLFFYKIDFEFNDKQYKQTKAKYFIQ